MIDRSRSGMKDRMTPPDPRPLSSGRDRILTAAALLFSRASFTEVSLRDIATAAQVDVAYVHRSFGSKAELFRQALIAELRFAETFQTTTDTTQLVETLCALFSAPPGDGGHDDAGRGRIWRDMVLRSCTSAAPQDMLRDIVLSRFVEPLVQRLGEDRRQGVMLMTGLLFGFAIQRDLLLPDAAATASADDAGRKRLRRIVQMCLDTGQPQPQPSQGCA